MGLTLRPRDWLLMLFDGAIKPIDRVRVQKAMFLFAQRSQASEAEKYHFQPYHYGPFSFEIYPDLEKLIAEGLIRGEEVPWLSSPVYSLTGLGREQLEELKKHAPEPRVGLMRKVREFVTVRNFNDLLRDIYALYPEYAVRSVFQKS